MRVFGIMHQKTIGDVMNWQGIPFKFLTEQTESLNLAVQTIPNLVLKSDPDYTAAFITGLVSLIAGLIPAGIAIYTFSKNTKLIKQERVEQQLFLKTEREEQQKFLKEERATQAASMEADRATQKEIAERNFNMQVLSANRQAWINRLRDLIAEYMAVAPDFLTAQHDFINRKEYYAAIAEKRKILVNSGSKSEAVNQTYSEASENLVKSIKHLSEMRQKEKLLTGNIKLMLNPEEKWYGVLEGIFGEVTIIYNSLETLDQDVLLEKFNNINSQISRCLICSQELLKYEWERVKKGE